MLTPAQIGAGMRISVHPHCDRFVPIILGALDDAAPLAAGLAVKTGPVSTYVGVTGEGAAGTLAAYANALIGAASRRSEGGHVVAHLLLSRGCPGEVTCELTPGELPTEAPVTLEPTGLTALADWSLYPLDDSGRDHMAVIEAAIAGAHGVDVTPPALRHLPLR